MQVRSKGGDFGYQDWVSGVSVDTVQRTGLRVPEPGRGDVQTLPERFLLAPYPRDHGEGSGTPSPLGDPPALPERIGCGKEAATPRRTAETCGNLSAQ